MTPWQVMGSDCRLECPQQWDRKLGQELRGVLGVQKEEAWVAEQTSKAGLGSRR